jgi:hypothetical protein
VRLLAAVLWGREESGVEEERTRKRAACLFGGAGDWCCYSLSLLLRGKREEQQKKVKPGNLGGVWVKLAALIWSFGEA